MQENRVVVIAGPTASGKSALAIDIAEQINGVVINADSMQVYKDMPIITAAPSAQDKARVPHKLFEIYDLQFRGNVVDWLTRAAEEIRNTWKEGKMPVVVGGTGLYIDNLINGTTPIPETPDKIRAHVQQLIDDGQLGFIVEELKKCDPKTAQKLNPNDVSRIKRAYEVYLHTKKPISVWHKEPLINYLPEAKYFVIKICPSVEELDQRAFDRFDEMVKAGVIDEVQKLFKLKLSPNLPSMKALGVPELMDYFKGRANVYVAVQNAKLHTRQYAKRQRTWFKNRLQADFVYPKCYKGYFPKEIIELLK